MSVERVHVCLFTQHVYLHSEVNEADKFRSADSLFSHNNANASQERANPPQYPETLATNQLTRFSSIHNNNDNISYVYKTLVEF